MDLLGLSPIRPECKALSPRATQQAGEVNRTEPTEACILRRKQSLLMSSYRPQCWRFE